jgi:hypothetical protein
MAQPQTGGAVAEPIQGTNSPTSGKVLPFQPKPDAYQNLERQVEVFKEVLKQSQESRAVFERAWWRILMYLLKRQWIFFDTKRNQWRDKRLAKWMPRPTNSKMNEGQQTLRSIFAAIQVGTISRPNGTDPLNVTTAEVSDALEPLIREEHDMAAVTRDQDFWLTGLGNVILHPWWNPDEGEVTMIPDAECLDCGLVHPAGTLDLAEPACESCGSPNVQPIEGSEQPISRGKGDTDVCSPLEILVPSGYQQWKDVRELIRVRWRSKSYGEAHYPPDVLAKIQWVKAPQERSLQLLKALASQSDLTATPFMSGGTGDMSENEGCVEYEMWLKTRPEFPKGYLGRFVGEGDHVLAIQDPQQSLPGPIPYTDKYKRPLWPWIHIGYDTFGGRLWSRGPMEDLIPLVDKLNRLDARIELATDRMSNGIWLEPKGSEVERLTGEPGIIVRYNALGTNGLGKPERIDGQNIPASLFALRQQYVDEIEQAIGTHDVLKGERPPNVEAFSAIQALIEQGQRRFTTVFQERGRGHREWYAIALELERDFGPEERVKAILGSNRTWSHEAFKKADLQGSVTILVEDGSTVPKTALGKRAAIDHANQLALINPQDPDQLYAVLSELGLKNLIPRIDKSVSAALREQHLYEQWIAGGRQEGTNPLVRIDYVDDDPVHVAQHKMWATSDAIRDLMLADPTAMQEIQMHIWEHENGVFQQAMIAGMADGKGGPGGGTPPGDGSGGEGAGASGGGPQGSSAPGGGQSMRNSNRESANPADATPRAA